MVALRWGRDRSTDDSGDSNLHELAMDFSLRLRNRIVVDVLVDPIVFRARTAFETTCERRFSRDTSHKVFSSLARDQS